MAKIRYYYDTESSQYKRHIVKKSDVIINASGIALLAIGFGCVFTICYGMFFESPNELKLGNEVREMEFYYDELNKKVETLSGVLSSIEKRDDNIYRTVLGTAPIDVAVREAGVGGYNHYTDILNKKLASSDLIIALTAKIDKLKRKLYIESLSQDEVVSLSEKKEKQFASIPAIQPIANKQLLAIASGFGQRIHPVYKVKKMHTGMDFSATVGTPVYATANGKISAVIEKFDGYGKMVVIDHGFGYMTRYAHLQDFDVIENQTVKRGQRIGFVGNTGLSTAPHLHYEVVLNGQLIDPVHYFFNDLSPLEYEKVLAIASVENQSLGN